MAHRWVTNINSLYDFIGYVVLAAHDEFPQEDLLQPAEQMTLDRAFEELRYGVSLVERDFPGADRQRRLTETLDLSLGAYRAGDSFTGAHALQDFQDLIFKQ